MCEHPDHEVVTLPDGQIDETHVHTDEELRPYAAGGILPTRRVCWTSNAPARVITAEEAAAILEDFKRYGLGNFKGAA